MNESIQPTRKRRKPRVSRAQAYSWRRRADRAKRAQRRPRAVARRQAHRVFKFRVKVVRYYWKLREQVREKRAVELTLARYKPREAGHPPLSASTMRRWARLAKREGIAALRPKSRHPKTIHYQVPGRVVAVIYTLRKMFGWGGHRIAAELKARGIGSVCGQTVYNIVEHLGLPVRVYALKGRSDGIAYTRYEKQRPNEQWHIDLKCLRLTDGTEVYVCIIIDDHSRYALAAVAGNHASAAWVSQVAKQAFVLAGHPNEVVSDNGREFVSAYEESLTQFGQLLLEHAIEHRTCAPHYPQGNGKIEAFIKTLNRELLQKHPFDTLDELQAALDRYLTYYNNYRAHSALGWKPPVTRFAGVSMTIHGLAGIPGIELMAADPAYGPSYCDPPAPISPSTAARSRALVLVG